MCAHARTSSYWFCFTYRSPPKATLFCCCCFLWGPIRPLVSSGQSRDSFISPVYFIVYCGVVSVRLHTVNRVSKSDPNQSQSISVLSLCVSSSVEFTRFTRMMRCLDDNDNDVPKTIALYSVSLSLSLS